MEAMAPLRLGREGKTESSRIFKTDIISPPASKALHFDNKQNKTKISLAAWGGVWVQVRMNVPTCKRSQRCG